MNNSTLPYNDIHHRLLKRIEQNPNISQRELAEELNVSLGKVNYCLKELVNVGWIKVGNFARSSNKLGYAYVLTPKGIKEKAAATLRFLKSKQDQYEQLQAEIELLMIEVSMGGRRSSVDEVDDHFAN